MLLSKYGIFENPLVWVICECELFPRWKKSLPLNMDQFISVFLNEYEGWVNMYIIT